MIKKRQNVHEHYRTDVKKVNRLTALYTHSSR